MPHTVYNGFRIAGISVMVSLFCCLSLAGQQDSFLFRGVVKDLPENPLSDVRVFTNRNTAGIKTDRTGAFSLNVGTGDTVFVKKDGYSFWSAAVDNAFIEKNSRRIRTVKLIMRTEKLKEVIVDGHLHPVSVLSSMSVDVGDWAVFFDPEERQILIILSEENHEKGVSRWIMIQGKDTINSIKFLRKRDWGV
ncbi:MAG: hypothetical protein LBC47_00915 [Tannerella sp.]|nr:hypothetical protein [Tannerella sp.]